jgi:kexin
MRFSSLLPLAFATLGFSSEPPPTPLRLDHTLNDHYVLQLDSRTDPEQVASRLDLRYEGPLGVLDHQHVYTDKKRSTDVVRDALQGRRMRKRRLGDADILDRVRWAQKQIPRRRVKRTVPPPNPQSFSSHPLPRQLQHDAKAVAQQKNVMTTLGIEDPIFKDQWHLLNTVEVGQDINCTGVWLQGFTGNGSIVAMVDDGLDMYSDDLKDNYYALGSWDFNDKTAEPKPRLSDDHHGTRCAGEIAAVRNHVCGVGVAYNAKISGLRILSKTIGDADEARAMIYDMDHNHIYSCSWGPPDDGKSMEAPGILIRQAMVKGVQRGRGGLGSIYVFASGNGAANDDNCNFDGYTNSIYSITIGAIDRKGNHPYYSEKCSAQLVVTYSSGSGDAIVSI